MAARELPNLGLNAFYDLGEDGWKDGMDLNLLKLSILVQGGVLSKVSATPATPDPGDVHIFAGDHPTNPNDVAVFDGETGEEEWKYFTPAEGWSLYNRAEDYYEKFDGATWAELATGGGSAEYPDFTGNAGKALVVNETEDGVEWALIEGGTGGGSGAGVVGITDADSNLLASQEGQYLRFSNAAAKTLTVQPEATEALPENGEWHLRNAGAADLTIVAGSGVTINPPADGTLVIAQGGTVTIKRVAEDEYDLLGQTVAA